MAALALAWLAAYMLHSTCVLGGTWLLLRCWRSRAWNLEDAVWRWGLLLPLLSASLHVGLLAGGQEPERPHGPPARAVAEKPGHALPLPGPPHLPRYAGPVALAAAGGEPPRETAPTPRAAPVPAEPVAPRPRAALSAHGASPPAARRTEGLAGSGWRLDWSLAILGVWGLVALVLLTRFLRARLLLKKAVGPRAPVCDPGLSGLIRELSRDSRLWGRVQLTCSDNVPTPVCLGPREICIPGRALSGIAGDQQEAMLAHEFSHLLRRDPVWLFLHGLLTNLLFFQPLNRLARARYQAAAEYLCDAWAARTTGSGLSLAASLAEVAGWLQRAPAPPAAMAGMAREGSQLVARIQHLLENGGRGLRRPPPLLRLAVPLLILGGGLALPGPSGEAFRDRQQVTRALPRPGLLEGVRVTLVALSHDLVLARNEQGTFTAALDGRPLGQVTPPAAGAPWSVGDGRTSFHLARDPDGCLVWDLASLPLTAGFDEELRRYGTLDDHDLAVICGAGDGSLHVRLDVTGSRVMQLEGTGDGPACETTASCLTIRAAGRPLFRIRLAPGAGGPGRGQRPELLGLTVAPVGEALAAQIGCAPDAASLVTAAPAGLPAARAGLRRFDVVTHLDGSTRAGPGDLAQRLLRRGGSGRLYLRILRAGRPRELSLALGSDAPPRQVPDPLGQLRELERRLAALEQARAPGAEPAEQDAWERLLARARTECSGAARHAADRIARRSRARIATALARSRERLRRDCAALRDGLPGRLRTTLGHGVPQARSERLVRRPLARELKTIEGQIAHSLTWLADERLRELDEERERHDGKRADSPRLKRWIARSSARDARLESRLEKRVGRCLAEVAGALQTALAAHRSRTGASSAAEPQALQEARLTQLGLTLGLLDLEVDGD